MGFGILLFVSFGFGVWVWGFVVGFWVLGVLGIWGFGVWGFWVKGKEQVVSTKLGYERTAVAPFSQEHVKSVRFQAKRDQLKI